MGYSVKKICILLGVLTSKMSGFKKSEVKMLKKLFANYPDAKEVGKPEKFLLLYVFFEALIRLVGAYYRERHCQKKKKVISNLESLNIVVVKRSFIHFSILIPDQRFDILLDSNLTKRNQKSARNLRNGLVHQWKTDDLIEVKERYEILCNALKEVIEELKIKIESASI